MKESLYDTLGADKDATPDEIKKAYRKKAIEHHPDKGGDIEEFNKVNEANEVLSDPSRRKKYDETGEFDSIPMKSKVEMLVDQLFWEALAGCLNPLSTDVISSMDNLISQKKQNIRRNIGQLKDSNKRLDKISKCIQVTKGENLLSMKLEHRITMNVENISAFEKEVDLYVETEKWLDNYGYESEEHGNPFSRLTSGTGTGSIYIDTGTF